MYQCRRCGKTSYPDKRPQSTDMMPCNGTSSSHDWIKFSVSDSTVKEKAPKVKKEFSLEEDEYYRAKSAESSEKTMAFIKKYIKPYWKVITPIYLAGFGATALAMGDLIVPGILFGTPLIYLLWLFWDTKS